MARRTDFHRVIIGRSEMLTFVGTDLVNVPAKTDTGAYSSSVHASNIQLKDGVLSFELLGGHPNCGAISCKMQVTEFSEDLIKNSSGSGEMRYEVKLKVKLGPKIFFTRFTLADRSKMIYPVLLGRKLLNGRFIVDSAETSLDRVALKERYGVELPKDEDDEEDQNENSDIV